MRQDAGNVTVTNGGSSLWLPLFAATNDESCATCPAAGCSWTLVGVNWVRFTASGCFVADVRRGFAGVARPAVRGKLGSFCRFPLVGFAGQWVKQTGIMFKR